MYAIEAKAVFVVFSGGFGKCIRVISEFGEITGRATFSPLMAKVDQPSRLKEAGHVTQIRWAKKPMPFEEYEYRMTDAGVWYISSLTGATKGQLFLSFDLPKSSILTSHHLCIQGPLRRPSLYSYQTMNLNWVLPWSARKKRLLDSTRFFIKSLVVSLF